jgi:uncharacterized protein YegP (UPF0339 family)
MTSYFEIKADAAGQFMFNLKAANNQVILTSQSYESKQGAKGGIASVQQNAVADDRYLRKMAKDKSPYFVLMATNGEIIGKSEMYSSTGAMEGGITSVKANSHSAATKEMP